MRPATLGHFPGHEADRVAAGNPDTPDETRALWQYFSDRPPVIYWEWHSNNWSRRPGHMLLRFRDSLIDDAGRRRDWVRTRGCAARPARYQA